jgi:hypothetical protein
MTGFAIYFIGYIVAFVCISTYWGKVEAGERRAFEAEKAKVGVWHIGYRLDHSDGEIAVISGLLSILWPLSLPGAIVFVAGKAYVATFTNPPKPLPPPDPFEIQAKAEVEKLLKQI